METGWVCAAFPELGFVSVFCRLVGLNPSDLGGQAILRQSGAAGFVEMVLFGQTAAFQADIAAIKAGTPMIFITRVML